MLRSAKKVSSSACGPSWTSGASPSTADVASNRVEASTVATVVEGRVKAAVTITIP